ncbi:GNAT family N-acetyltransferase [Natronoglycomyces albus]|uniref:GNAT family N-acetyltransferase n=1 Tax=Natronoglycomyces albus TaxID=2811108 RepID=A0A895XSN5_9ACTN|nr:GNAT family N-acetyltransferase [Natronoglycomyces albus]QSB05556.1 GNAT family N-acetyltransferase [Natronoglycomyces albus]
MILSAADIMNRLDQIAAAYADIFAEPPFNRDPLTASAHYRHRLLNDAQRPGFRAAIAQTDGKIAAFATGWQTLAPFRTDRAYPQVSEQLGAQRVETSLVGAFEVDQLGVLAHSRGQGLGRAMLDELIADVPRQRAWLLTWSTAKATIDFYRHVGWRQLRPLTDTTGAEVKNDVVVFVSPAVPEEN